MLLLLTYTHPHSTPDLPPAEESVSSPLHGAPSALSGRRATPPSTSTAAGPPPARPELEAAPAGGVAEPDLALQQGTVRSRRVVSMHPISSEPIVGEMAHAPRQCGHLPPFFTRHYGAIQGPGQSHTESGCAQRHRHAIPGLLPITADNTYYVKLARGAPQDAAAPHEASDSPYDRSYGRSRQGGADYRGKQRHR